MYNWELIQLLIEQDAGNEIVINMEKVLHLQEMMGDKQVYTAINAYTNEKDQVVITIDTR